METPTRSGDRSSRCRCVMMQAHQTMEQGWCRDFTSGPDDPFCEVCTDRHAGEFNETVTVTVMPLGTNTRSN